MKLERLPLRQDQPVGGVQDARVTVATRPGPPELLVELGREASGGEVASERGGERGAVHAANPTIPRAPPARRRRPRVDDS